MVILSTMQNLQSIYPKASSILHWYISPKTSSYRESSHNYNVIRGAWNVLLCSDVVVYRNACMTLASTALKVSLALVSFHLWKLVLRPYDFVIWKRMTNIICSFQRRIVTAILTIMSAKNRYFYKCQTVTHLALNNPCVKCVFWFNSSFFLL